MCQLTCSGHFQLQNILRSHAFIPSCGMPPLIPSTESSGFTRRRADLRRRIADTGFGHPAGRGGYGARGFVFGREPVATQR